MIFILFCFGLWIRYRVLFVLVAGMVISYRGDRPEKVMTTSIMRFGR